MKGFNCSIVHVRHGFFLQNVGVSNNHTLGEIVWCVVFWCTWHNFMPAPRPRSEEAREEEPAAADLQEIYNVWNQEEMLCWFINNQYVHCRVLTHETLCPLCTFQIWCGIGKIHNVETESPSSFFFKDFQVACYISQEHGMFSSFGRKLRWVEGDVLLMWKFSWQGYQAGQIWQRHYVAGGRFRSTFRTPASIMGWITAA